MSVVIGPQSPTIIGQTHTAVSAARGSGNYDSSNERYVWVQTNNG
jgi:hypothetical protein